MYAIRDARQEDVPALQELDALFAGPRHSDELFLKAIFERRVGVAEEGGSGVLAGYVRWDYFWDTIPLCFTVCVRPENQRQGIGRRLYEHVETALRDAGAAFWLSSTEETNKRSLLFHDALGFRRIGTLFDLGQDVGEIFLRKDLA